MPVCVQNIDPRVIDRITDRNVRRQLRDLIGGRDHGVFRRAVAIVQIIVLPAERFQLVPARQKNAQRRMVHRHEMLAELGRQKADRNAVLFKVRMQLRRIQADFFGNDVNRRPRHQIRKHLPHGSVKAEAGVFGGPVLLGHSEFPDVPGAQIDKRSVLDHHAFRPSRRTGSVDDVSHVARFRRFAHIPHLCIGSLRFAANIGRKLRRANHPAFEADFSVQSDLRLGDKQLRSAVFEHIRDAVGGIRRIDRQVGRARFQDRQRPDDHLKGRRRDDADDLLAASSPPYQFAGQSVRFFVQLAVRQRFALVDHRDVIRSLVRLLLKQAVDGPVQFGMRSRLVPARKLGLLFFRQQLQAADRHV